MFFDDLLDRGETQACAGPLRGEEWLKDFVDDFCRNGRAVVLDEDLIFYAAPRAMLGDLNMEMASRAHGFARVLKNAQKDLLDFGFVAADRCDYRRIVLGHLDSGDFEIGGDHRQCAFDDFGYAEEPPVQLERFREV